ncbi:MAG: hypothetical protein Q8L57_00615 [bacterium]|nr:hypothetical protein [bacterium]
MKFFMGQDRVVLLFESLVAIKFARIRLWRIFTIFCGFINKKSRFERLRDIILSSVKDIERYGTISGMLFRGIKENWQEFRFWRRYRLKFLAPTYFSLFGIINFQKTGRPYNGDEVWPKLFKWNEKMAFKDAHTLGEPKNFCLIGGRIKIVDYGSRRVQEVLLAWAKDGHDAFDD